MDENSKNYQKCNTPSRTGAAVESTATPGFPAEDLRKNRGNRKNKKNSRPGL